MGRKKKVRRMKMNEMTEQWLKLGKKKIEDADYVAAVSYTHLDVYKRQDFQSSRSYTINAGL